MKREVIGHRLRLLRRDKTQEEIAALCGVTRQAVNQYEKGARIPNDEVKEKLAKVFNTTVQDIFYND